MKKISTGYSSDSEQNNKQDLSVLRKPIVTGLTGFLESKRAYDNGTEEVRRILSRECDILYECKVCRNIFRSLTNFISHKRVYCRTAFNNLTNQFNVSNGYVDVSTIIQEERDFIKNSTTKDNKNNENSNKDLSSIIERLLKREQSNRLMQLSDFYDQVSNKLTQDELLRKKHELQLDRVPNSSVAVYQTVKKEPSDSIKKEVNEINDLVHNKGTIIGLDGKIVLNKNTKVEKCDSVETKFKENNQKSQDNEIISCDICGLEFTTEKTLKLHLQAKHISATFVYQCPSCSQTFLQPHAVYRHLSNEHKKSIRRIRMMRESILKRRIRIDEVQAKAPSRELARLQTDSEKREADSKSWMNSANTSSSSSPICVHCGKTFERKAVLTTHLNSCPMKTKCPGPQTRRLAELANSTSKNEDSLSRMPSILNGYDLNELRDIKEMDLNNMNGHSNENGEVPSRNFSPVNKRKRKRTSKVLQTTDAKCDRTESLDDLFWSIESSVENMSLKTVSLDNSPSSTPPPKLDPQNIDSTPEKDNTTKVDQSPPVKKSEKNLESALALKSHKQVSFYCRICVKKFDVLSNLRRHISMFHYRKRKFGCKLCDYRAFRKYDVINHLSSNHSITGEREEVLLYVVVKESKGDRTEENIDADVIVDENGTFGANLAPKLVDKRRRRGKMKEAPKFPTESPPAEVDVSASIKVENKFARTPSNLSLSSNEEGSSSSSLSKRPIRNRVKPVNKDFVYDLSNLLKKDMVLSEKTQRRRNTQAPIDDNSRDSVTPPTATVFVDTQAPRLETTDTCRNVCINPKIKGAASVMAQLAVDSFSACFYKPPELPMERPSIITRIAASVNGVEAKTTDWPLHKPLEIRRPSEDNILHALQKRRRLDESFKSNPKSTSGGLSIDFSLNGNGGKATFPSNREEVNESDKIIVKLFASEKEFNERLVANKLVDSIASAVESMKFSTPSPLVTNGAEVSAQSQLSVIQSSGLTPSSSTKRITLLERMAENKKLRESTHKFS